MGGRTDHRRAERGWQARWYECKHGHAGADVRHRVAAARLEDAVWGEICRMVQEPDTVLARFERLADAASAEAREIEDEISRLAECQAENRLAQQRLLERAVRGKLAADLIGAQEDALEAEAHELAARRALLEVQLEQARAGQAPLRQVRDALALLADGLLEATFEDKRWIIRQLVTRIWADKQGWELEGCLPELKAEGTFAPAASLKCTPVSNTGRHGGVSA
jgi:site-specific DNA recombinase